MSKESPNPGKAHQNGKAGGAPADRDLSAYRTHPTQENLELRAGVSSRLAFQIELP